MAGLGQNVSNNHALTARMNGNIQIGGTGYTSWYFTDGSPMGGRGFMGDRDLPSAHFECVEGQLVSINFQNRSMMEHTIHLHGLDVDQLNDGVPTTSFAVPAMGSHTYQFTAPHAGTYHYHCHVDTVIHYARGMHGAIIVRPAGGATNIGWSGGPTFQEEVLWQLSTIDTSWMALMASGPANARFRPNAFLLNGFEAPAAKADVYSRVVIQQGQKAYIRVLNASYHWARVKMGGLNFEVVATDGRPMLSAPSVTEWELGPGERYDLLLTGASAAAVEATIDYLDDHSGGVLGTAKTDIQIV
jgi:FtsP/CotA-like multicopper oxidase with cupredoxin domain